MSDRKPQRNSRKTERFQRIPIFSSHLSPEEVARVLSITRDMEMSEGEVIFKPGQANDGFYIITDGRVQIEMLSAEGERVVIATLSNRSVFGEMSFLGERERSAWAIATRLTKLTKVDGARFRQMLDEGDVAAYKVIHNFAKLISARLRRVEDELLNALEDLAPQDRDTKLAELQEFRQKLFQEWSF